MYVKLSFTFALILVITVAITDCQETKPKGKLRKGGAGGGFNKEFMMKKMQAMKEKCAENVANITACLGPSCTVTDICADFKKTMTECVPQAKRMEIFNCLKTSGVISIPPGMKKAPKKAMKKGRKGRRRGKQTDDDDTDTDDDDDD